MLKSFGATGSSFSSTGDVIPFRLNNIAYKETDTNPGRRGILPRIGET